MQLKWKNTESRISLGIWEQYSSILAFEMYITKEKLHLLCQSHGNSLRCRLFLSKTKYLFATLSVAQRVLPETDMVLRLSKPSSLDCWVWMT